jgi:hypothetical protein
VLKHYSCNSSDSLKLQAAKFLIANMPGKYSLEYEIPFEHVVAAYMRWDDHEDPKTVNRVFGFDRPTVKEDVKHITADSLINNIELAFRMWKEQPWVRMFPLMFFARRYYHIELPTSHWNTGAKKYLQVFPK